MKLTPHVNFDGRCEEAFNAYARIFGGTLAMTSRWKDMPGGQCPPGWGEKLMHGRVAVGDTVIVMGADSPPGRHTAPQGVSLSVEMATNEEAERVFAALGAGGQVTMAMAPTFFAQRFGMCTDRFGVSWMVVSGVTA